MRARVEIESEQAPPASSSPAPGNGARRDGSQVRHVESTSANLATDPGFGGLIEVSRG